jgi:hypothetical protein
MEVQSWQGREGRGDESSAVWDVRWQSGGRARLLLLLLRVR